MYSVTIKELHSDKNPNWRGVAEISIDNAFHIGNIQMRNRKDGGIFLDFPHYNKQSKIEGEKDTRVDFAYPSKTFRDELEAAVKNALDNGMTEFVLRADQEETAKPFFRGDSVFTGKNSKHNLYGNASIAFGENHEMTVNQCTLRRKKPAEGEEIGDFYVAYPKITRPNPKDPEKPFRTSVCCPLTPEMAAGLKEKVVKEYDRQCIIIRKKELQEYREKQALQEAESKNTISDPSVNDDFASFDFDEEIDFDSLTPGQLDFKDDNKKEEKKAAPKKPSKGAR